MDYLISRIGLSWQTRNTRQLGAQPPEVLHLERLEKARTKEEKPQPSRSELPPCLCMEQNAKGRVGNCAITYSDNHDYTWTLSKTRLWIHARLLLKSAPWINVHGHLLYIMNRRIRGPYVRWYFGRLSRTVRGAPYRWKAVGPPTRLGVCALFLLSTY